MKTSKSAVFLFELMIIILVFTIAAAVCTKIFANSYSMSEESRALTMSSICAQSVAEHYKATDGVIDAWNFQKNYYKDWNELSLTSPLIPTYTISIEEEGCTGTMNNAYIRVYKTHFPYSGAYIKPGTPLERDEIYSLHVKDYIG